MVEALIETLASDVATFIEKERGFFFNECDMQVRLCYYLLAKGKYDAVIPEYRVPLAELVERGVRAVRDGKRWEMSPSFPWSNDIFVDIVVESAGVFACLELKYATVPIRDSLCIFGEPPIDRNVKIIKNQSAQDLVMYNYWKDVRRIEILRDKFGTVAGGAAVLVTNDNVYWEPPRPEAGYVAFSTHEGNRVGGGIVDWCGTVSSSTRGSHAPFEMTGEYRPRWRESGLSAISVKGKKFRYIINTIQ